MTAEAYELNGDDHVLERPPEPSLELLRDESAQEALKLAEDTYVQFQKAFAWDADDTDALFERIAGSTEPMSEGLSSQLFELYMTSLSSSFVQDDMRSNYKFIFEKFARYGHDVAAIREFVADHEKEGDTVDNLYITKHLLLTISKMSMHQE